MPSSEADVMVRRGQFDRADRPVGPIHSSVAVNGCLVDATEAAPGVGTASDLRGISS